MSMVLRYAIFISVMVGIIATIHAYFWFRLVRDPAWPAPWRTVGTALIIALAASIPLVFVLGRAMGPPWREVVAWPVFIWMGAMFILLVLLAAWDLSRPIGAALMRFTAAAAADPPDPERRLLVARMVAGGAALGLVGLSSVALRAGLQQPHLRRIAVSLPRLPRALDGFGIVQISDLHVGPTIRRDFVARMVERTNALQPDLVVITGDLVDGGVGELRQDIAPLADLQARHGTYFVTGNHEYYAGVQRWLQELARLGIRVLRNERVSIGDGNASFDLAGVDDSSAGKMAQDHGPDLRRALKGRDATRELVLLAHQPREIFTAAKLGVGLQLSGHTHGGQIWPFGGLVRLTQPYVSGLHRHGAAQIYVSRGTGHWGPPMRLAAPSELTYVELHPEIS